jgi:enamine deaminase RidA (YjgF/YER057c/UK114 family)
MGLWAKSVVIFNSICAHGKQSIRSLADHTGLSKSSVHRHLQAMDRRDRYPESSLWETPAGRAWLVRLVVATLFVFGLKRGVGAETLSEFFTRLHLEAPVGCSPSALRTVMHLLERLLLETATAWEKEGIAHGEIRPVIGAVDETFLQRIMLVFMDLATGYVLMEEVAADRSYATWFDRANDRLTTFGTEVLYMVSDRAKALIKLAHTGLRCPSIPDVFHLGHDLAKSYSLCIFGRLRQAKRDLEQAKQHLEKLQKEAQANPDQVAQAQGRVTACSTSVHHWQEVGRAWRQHLSNVSRLLHPWRLADSIRQTSQEVEEQLRAELKAIKTLLETNGLPMKQNTLDKVQKQLAGISALVDVWWQTVRQDLTQLAMTPRWTQWAEEVLLPLMYWQEQLRRTRCPGQKAQMALVLQAVAEAFERHPCTRQLKPEVLAGWKAWAGEHARAFQRASSAVEGRNGYLSQMQHNHRGLPTRRYQVWTVLHNFDCRAANGTTPASRFFRRSFPDLFESVLSQIDELPMPRQRRQAIAASN